MQWTPFLTEREVCVSLTTSWVSCLGAFLVCDSEKESFPLLATFSLQAGGRSSWGCHPIGNEQPVPADIPGGSPLTLRTRKDGVWESREGKGLVTDPENQHNGSSFVFQKTKCAAAKGFC